MEKKYRLELIGITYNQIESGVYAVILQQIGTSRRIPIIIGFPEAQAIECKLQEIATPRPLTHDTMASALSAFGISLRRVEIRRLQNGVFAADLVLSDGVNERTIDSRSSDAIALAIRVNAPIYTSEKVLLEAGFDANNLEANEAATPEPTLSDKNRKDSGTSDLSSMSLQQLSDAMIAAAENENYEEAARIKSEIDKRQDNNVSL